MKEFIALDEYRDEVPNYIKNYVNLNLCLWRKKSCKFLFLSMML
jgi:hypothetical protein